MFAEIALQAISLYTFIAANVFQDQQIADGVDVPEGVPIAEISGHIGLVETLVGSLGWIIMFGLVVMMMLAVFAFHKWTVRQIRDWCFLAVVVTLGCNWLFWDGYLREFPHE